MDGHQGQGSTIALVHKRKHTLSCPKLSVRWWWRWPIGPMTFLALLSPAHSQCSAFNSPALFPFLLPNWPIIHSLCSPHTGKGKGRHTFTFHCHFAFPSFASFALALFSFLSRFLLFAFTHSLIYLSQAISIIHTFFSSFSLPFFFSFFSKCTQTQNYHDHHHPHGCAIFSSH